MRAYKTEPIIWDGDSLCQHHWGNSDKTLSHKSGETNPGKEAWYKEKGASDDEGSQFCLTCKAWRGELGLEPDFNLYIDHLIQIFGEVKRVLKPTGTCWVNIGDSYFSNNPSNRNGINSETWHGDELDPYCIGQKIPKINRNINYPAKSLVGIPERFALAMTDRLGWIRRNTLIWYKRNCMPSSASDRFTADFEYVYFFTKQGKYWFEQQFEEYKLPLDRWGGIYTDGNVPNSKYLKEDIDPAQITKRPRSMRPNEQGRNMRCVWSIPTQPYKEAHFATFPEKLVEPMIKAGCPKEVCKKCGKAREKEYEKMGEFQRRWSKNNAKGSPYNKQGSMQNTCQEAGYTDCGCNAGWTSGICLDLFMGSGTVAVVAKKLGRQWIGVELNPAYIKMAEKRIAKASYQPEIRMEGYD